jgi:hypothetical protein
MLSTTGFTAATAFSAAALRFASLRVSCLGVRRSCTSTCCFTGTRSLGRGRLCLQLRWRGRRWCGRLCRRRSMTGFLTALAMVRRRFGGIHLLFGVGLGFLRR